MPDYGKAALNKAAENDKKIGDLSQNVNTQLSQKANDTDVRKKDVKLSQTDMTTEFLQQVAGTASINSIPQDASVDYNKLTSTFQNLFYRFFNVMNGKYGFTFNTDYVFYPKYWAQNFKATKEKMYFKMKAKCSVTNGANLKLNADLRVGNTKITGLISGNVITDGSVIDIIKPVTLPVENLNVDLNIWAFASEVSDTNATYTMKIEQMMLVNIDYTELSQQDYNYLINTWVAEQGVTQNFFVPKKTQSDVIKTQTAITLIAFGDSMTGNDAGWPRGLRDQYGVSVINRGIGGQNAGMIAARQGGEPLVVQPFTIPADTSQVPVTINYSGTWYAQSGYEGVNPCYINGIKGSLRCTDKVNVFFQREAAGSVVQVNRPTNIITDNMINLRNNPMIIWVGTNGDYVNTSRNASKIIEIIDKMISYNQSRNYIVIGLTTDTNFGSVTVNDALSLKYGQRFLDLRSYVISRGLADMGYTPTQADLDKIAANNVPTQLLADDTHFKTEVQNKLFPSLIFEKMQALGMAKINIVG